VKKAENLLINSGKFNPNV